MDDGRVWAFEESLWTGDARHYQELIDPEILMVLPTPPYVLAGQQAIDAVAGTPRWNEAVLSERQVSRPQEGLIIVAYKVDATRDDQRYTAHCTSTYRRLEHDVWRVLQHQQTPPIVAVA